MGRPSTFARFFQAHPALTYGLLWGLVMITVMTAYNVFQGEPLVRTLIINIPFYGLGGLAFGFAMKWGAHRRAGKHAEAVSDTDKTQPPAA